VVSIYYKENLELRSKTATPNSYLFTTTASPAAKELLEAELRTPIKERVILDPPSEPVSKGTVGDHALYDWGFSLTTSKKKKKKIRKPPLLELDGIIELLLELVLELVLEVGLVPELELEPAICLALEPVPEAELVIVPEQEPEIEATPVFKPLCKESIAIPEAD
jgi:hypothetical protein